MSGLEPEDRELFEKHAVELYDLVVQEGGIAPDDPRFTNGSLKKDALDLLVELNLVQIDTRVNQWRALEPANVQARIVTPLSTEGVRLLDESARWAKAFQSLAQSWKRSPQPESSEAFTYLHGQAISPYLTALLGDAEQELLTAQPQAGRGGRRWPPRRCATSRRSSGACRCARSTSTARGGTAPPGSTSRT